MNKDLLIGFIGQGWIGKNYADNFEQRGYRVVRYALEAPYHQNKDRIKDCDIVFIAVPTPTTPAGFDDSIVREAVALVGIDKIAIIKSTILPGTTKQIQKDYDQVCILYSPEFLSEATAAQDAAHPFSNIVGLPVEDQWHQEAAEKVLAVLPPAKFVLVCDSTEAELIKYSHNINGYFQIILFNILFDLSQKLGANWDVVRQAIAHDPYMTSTYAQPIHKSGRGAGGGCFIKDFAAFKKLYTHMVDDERGYAVLASLEEKNLQLLRDSSKDQHLVDGVYSSK